VGHKMDPLAFVSGTSFNMDIILSLFERKQILRN
jgi:hypothetical protein